MGNKPPMALQIYDYHIPSFVSHSPLSRHIGEFFDHPRDERHLICPCSGIAFHSSSTLAGEHKLYSYPALELLPGLSKLVLYVSGSDAPRKLDLLLLGCLPARVRLEALSFLACGSLSAVNKLHKGVAVCRC